jgi:hypothetical protein
VDDDVPAGWDRDSDQLFLHPSGVRIERRTYRKQDGWALVPADLDQAVLMFPPDPAGRAKAFLAFAAGVLDPGKKEAALKLLKERETAEAEEEGEDDNDEDA